MNQPRSIEALKAALAATPDDASAAFRLGLAYRDAESYDSALSAFDLRARMAGLDQEVFLAQLYGARVAALAGRSQAEIVDRFLRAWEFRPGRAEALGSLTTYLRENGPRWRLGYVLASLAIRIPPTADALYVEPEWQQWRCLDEYAVAAYWVGEYARSRDACQALLASDQLPAKHRARIETNLQHALAKIA